MKKTILIFFIFCYHNITAQINNLSDLLEISELSSYGLVEYLQSTWEIKKPIEQFTSDRSKVIGTYSFANNDSNQILQRIITMEVATGEEIETTNFICNDMELLKRIIKNLPYKEYELKRKRGNKSFYEDGNSIISIELNLNGKNSVISVMPNVIKYKTIPSIPRDSTPTSSPNSSGIGSGSGYGSGNGSGIGSSTGYSLGNRKALSKPQPDYTCQEQGRVAVQVVVDRNGSTISVTSGVQGTTNTARCLLEQARIAALNTKWQADNDAPEKQVGKIIYSFSLDVLHLKPDSPFTENKEGDDTIYSTAGIEERPDFPGGLDKFYKFIDNNFVIPRKKGLDGKIFVTFIVEKDGSLSDIKVLRDIGYDTGYEALRVLKLCPKWNPGKQNGKAVRTLYSLPINITTN